MSKDLEKDGQSLEDAVDTAEKLLKENKSRISTAYKTAMEKSFGPAWYDKLQFWKWHKTVPLFIENFFKELSTVQQEKEKVTEEAEAELVQEVLGEGNATYSAAETIADSMDEENTFDPEEKEAVTIFTEDVLEAAKATGSQGKIFARIKKLNEKADEKEDKEDKKDPEALTDQEIRLAFSMGLFTMVRLRQRFDTQEKLETFLTKLQKAGDKSGKLKRFSKYITNNFKKLFKFEATQVPDLLGYGWFEKTKFLSLLGSKDKLKDGLDLVLPDLFPKAVKRKGLVPLRKFFVRLMNQKRHPTPKTIAELVFMIDHEEDMRNLAKRIGGISIVSLASVKETEERKAKANKEKESAKAENEAEKKKTADAESENDESENDESEDDEPQQTS